MGVRALSPPIKDSTPPSWLAICVSTALSSQGRSASFFQIQNVDSAKELPLLRHQFDSFAVAGENRVLRHADIDVAARRIFSSASLWRKDCESAGDGET